MATPNPGLCDEVPALMRHYAAALPARSLIDGATGRSSEFVRTPKRVVSSVGSDVEGCGCARNPQVGSRISVRLSFTQSGRRGPAENHGRRMSLPANNTPPMIAGTVGIK